MLQTSSPLPVPPNAPFALAGSTAKPNPPMDRSAPPLPALALLLLAAVAGDDRGEKCIGSALLLVLVVRLGLTAPLVLPVVVGVIPTLALVLLRVLVALRALVDRGLASPPPPPPAPPLACACGLGAGLGDRPSTDDDTALLWPPPCTLPLPLVCVPRDGGPGVYE